MKVIIYHDENQIAEAVAMLFASKILKKSNCVLGFATGSTPLPLYNKLVDLYKREIVDFSKVKTFNLDEYVGIERSHPQSYHSFMFDNLFSKINVKPENVHLPNPGVKNACKAYDKLIEKAGGIDLQILGIGNNGHIAFNEPASEFSKGTNIVELTESTIEANKRFFTSAKEVPKKAITMGIESIMKSKEIVLIATGKAKAKAVKEMIKGKVNPKCPASILQKHQNTIIFLDHDAAELI